MFNMNYYKTNREYKVIRNTLEQNPDPGERPQLKGLFFMPNYLPLD